MCVTHPSCMAFMSYFHGLCKNKWHASMNITSYQIRISLTYRNQNKTAFFYNHLIISIWSIKFVGLEVFSSLSYNFTPISHNYRWWLDYILYLWWCKFNKKTNAYSILTWITFICKKAFLNEKDIIITLQNLISTIWIIITSLLIRFFYQQIFTQMTIYFIIPRNTMSHLTIFETPNLRTRSKTLNCDLFSCWFRLSEWFLSPPPLSVPLLGRIVW